MDFSLIPSALAAISGSISVAKTALEVRDFNSAGAAISEITQKLIDLQTQVIAGNGAFMQLQQEHSALAQKVRVLEELRTERERYSLFEISTGTFVYRLNVAPQTAGADNPQGPEPMHYLCPRCFGQQAKSILQRHVVWGTVNLECPVCNTNFDSGERVPTKSIY